MMKNLTKPTNYERGSKPGKRGLIGNIIHSYSMSTLGGGQESQPGRWLKKRIVWIYMILLMVAGVTPRTAHGIMSGDLTCFRVLSHFTNISGNPPIFRTACMQMWL